MTLPHQALLFDLDGTIIDSSPGIFLSLRPAFAALGLPDPDTALLRRFIGPPLAESFSAFCGLSPCEITQGIAVFRSHYEAKGKLLCSAYPGLDSLLAALHAAGRRLFVATSKPEMFAVEILTNLGLIQYFEGVYGADLSEKHEKWQVIAKLLEEHPELNRANALMIGDRKYDVLGAAQCQLDCVGVLYGFGDRLEFLQAGAAYITDTVTSLGTLLLP